MEIHRYSGEPCIPIPAGSRSFHEFCLRIGSGDNVLIQTGEEPSIAAREIATLARRLPSPDDLRKPLFHTVIEAELGSEPFRAALLETLKKAVPGFNERDDHYGKKYLLPEPIHEEAFIQVFGLDTREFHFLLVHVPYLPDPQEVSILNRCLTDLTAIQRGFVLPAQIMREIEQRARVFTAVHHQIDLRLLPDWQFARNSMQWTSITRVFAPEVTEA